VREINKLHHQRLLVSIFISYLIVLLPGFLAFPQTDLSIQIYNFKADPGIKVGYPSGWIVQETEMGVVIQEKNSADTAGLILFLMPLEEGVTSEELANNMISLLRDGTYPDITPVSCQSHPQVPEIHILDATLTADGMTFRLHTWSLADNETGVGIFSGFYAPSYRYVFFDVEKLLTSCMAPLFK